MQGSQSFISRPGYVLNINVTLLVGLLLQPGAGMHINIPKKLTCLSLMAVQRCDAPSEWQGSQADRLKCWLARSLQYNVRRKDQLQSARCIHDLHGNIIWHAYVLLQVRQDIDHRSYMPAAWRVDEYLNEEEDEEDDLDLSSLKQHK